MNETDLSKGIRQALRAKGCRVIRVQTGIIPALYGATKRFIHCAENGTPDWLVIREPAVYTWLEVKIEGGRLTPAQQAWHEWAVSAGLRVAVVRSISEAIAAVFAPRIQHVPAPVASSLARSVSARARHAR
jgi:hypothetical protein